MDETPNIVLLISAPDLDYANHLANNLRGRSRGLNILINDIAEIKPIPSRDVSLYVLLLGPNGLPEDRLASLAKTLRQAIADDRIVDLVSDTNRVTPWKLPGHFVDESDWSGEPKPIIADEILAYFKSYTSKYSLTSSSITVADNSNIMLPNGSISLNRNLFTRITDIEFSVRTATSLRNDNVMFVGDLVQRTDYEILRIPNMGRKSLNEIKEVLKSMDLTLGLSPVGWPPENLEHELARTDVARRAAALEQKPGGATFAANDDRLAMDVAGDDSDRETAERPITQQMHDEIKRKAHAFADLAHRLDNQIGWAGISALGERLDAFLAVPTVQIPEILGYLYPAALELGSFLEMDNALRASAQSYAAPLDIEVRRPLEDLVRSFAPWLRGFPSVRQMDDDAGRFLVGQADLESTTTIIQTARAIELISEEDAETLHALTEAAVRGIFQGEKAAGRVTLSVRNMVYLGASIVGTFFLGSVASDFSTKSLLVQRTGTFLASAESAILELVADLPHDLRLSISDLVRESLILPEAPADPIESDPANNATLAGRRPPRGRRT